MQFSTKNDLRKDGVWLYFTSDQGVLITVDQDTYEATEKASRCAFRVRAQGPAYDNAIDRLRKPKAKQIRKGNLGISDTKALMYEAMAETLIADTDNVFDNGEEVKASDTSALRELFFGYPELADEVLAFASEGLNFDREAAKAQAGKSQTGSRSGSSSGSTAQS